MPSRKAAIPAITDRDASLMAMSMALTTLSRSYRTAVDKAVAHAGLSQALALPLVMLGRQGDGLRPGVLAGLLGIEGPSLVRSLSALVDAGLIEYRGDAIDGRAKTLYMKPAGVRICARIEAVLQELRGDLYGEVSDADVAACLRMFAALDSRLNRKTPALAAATPAPARQRSRAA